MVRAAADARIVDISISQPTNGTAGIEVVIENQNSSPASGETHDIAYVVVDAPHMAEPPMWWCGVIEPGAQAIVDGSSGGNGLNGEIEIPQQATDVLVEVGGVAGDALTDCANVLSDGTATDSQTVTLGDGGGGGGGIDGRMLLIGLAMVGGAYYLSQR